METCQTCGGTQGLSAMEGVGGTIQRGEERHISFWKALLMAPEFPKGCTPQSSRPQRNSCGPGAVVEAEHGRVLVHTRPWQAVQASAQNGRPCLCVCAKEECQLLACFLFPQDSWDAALVSTEPR